MDVGYTDVIKAFDKLVHIVLLYAVARDAAVVRLQHGVNDDDDSSTTPATSRPSAA